MRRRGEGRLSRGCRDGGEFGSWIVEGCVDK